MIAQFALRLIWGMSLMWCMMPRRQVTSGFFRIQMLVALGLSVLASQTLPPAASSNRFDMVTIEALCYLLAAVAFVGSALWRLERRGGGTGAVFLLSALAALALALTALIDEPRFDRAATWDLFSAYSSGALIGSVVTAMLLGHWYLTAPTMSIDPLRRLTLLLVGAIGVRLLVASAGTVSLWSAGDAGSTLHGVWLALRWLAGIIAPALLCGMTLRILKYRNTQAATGVLFAAVILVFIGEMTALLIQRDLSYSL